MGGAIRNSNAKVVFAGFATEFHRKEIYVQEKEMNV